MVGIVVGGGLAGMAVPFVGNPFFPFSPFLDFAYGVGVQLSPPQKDVMA